MVYSLYNILFAQSFCFMNIVNSYINAYKTYYCKKRVNYTSSKLLTIYYMNTISEEKD